MQPEVSICIPAFKQVEYLRKTLNSVLAQTYTDYEIIVSDDSPDDSVKNLLGHFDFGNKLKYFKNTPGLGTPSNWNYAISKAQGKYIKLLHHDDFFLSPESLQKFVKLLSDRPDASFAFSATEILILFSGTKQNHSCSRAQLKKIINSPEQLFFANYIGSPSATIVRKNNNILYDGHLKWLVDVDYYIQLLKRNPIVAHTAEPLICTVDGAEGQVTKTVINNKEIQIREHVYLFNKLFHPEIHLKKFSVFFQLLFHKHDVKNLKELTGICIVPGNLANFFTKVFDSKDKNIFLKKILFWQSKSNFNDYLLMLKKYF
jgi:glycosyltransferase involved in cell wall biosynthesis